MPADAYDLSLNEKAYASMNIAILFLIGTIIVVSLVACVLFLQRKVAPILQFSLRTFFVLVAIVAVIFGSTMGYRQNYMAQLTWIPVATVVLFAFVCPRYEIITMTTKRSRRLRDTAFRMANGVCAVCDRDYSKLLNGKGIRVLQAHHKRMLSKSEDASMLRC